MKIFPEFIKRGENIFIKIAKKCNKFLAVAYNIFAGRES
jgi:hypothetical protein